MKNKLLKIMRFVKQQLSSIKSAIYKMYFYPYIRKYLILQANQSHINDIFSKNVLFSERSVGNDKVAICHLFNGKFHFLGDDKHSKNVDIAIIWGLNTNHCNIKTIVFAMRNHKNLLIAEDGFLRSIHTWSGKVYGGGAYPHKIQTIHIFYLWESATFLCFIAKYFRNYAK